MRLDRPMMHDRSIWTAAIYLVDKHGEAAVTIAERQAVRFGDRDDDAGVQAWLRVMQAAAELVRQRQKEETLH